jgi:hypothetical protein
LDLRPLRLRMEPISSCLAQLCRHSPRSSFIGCWLKSIPFPSNRHKYPWGERSGYVMPGLSTSPHSAVADTSGRSVLRGLVRTPVPFSERHDEWQHKPFLACVVFSLFLAAACTCTNIGSDTNTHQVSTLRQIRAIAPSRLLGKSLRHCHVPVRK